MEHCIQRAIGKTMRFELFCAMDGGSIEGFLSVVFVIALVAILVYLIIGVWSDKKEE